MDKKKDLASKLRTSGLRPTKQRIKLAEFLFDRDKTFHFTVENLNRAINKKNAEDKIALATIYNTVHAFKRAGHLKEILIKEGKNYFDTNTSSHHHFYDEVNNELTDIENNKIELKKFPTPPKGKSIKNVNVIINIDNDNQKHQFIIILKYLTSSLESLYDRNNKGVNMALKGSKTEENLKAAFAGESQANRKIGRAHV